MKKCIVTLMALGLVASALQAQVLLSGGLTYSQDFDSLASELPTGQTTIPWTDNVTLVGWYASRATTTSGGAYGPYPYTSYRVGGGEGNNGWIWSFGINGVNPITDRAFGSISSGTPATNAWGLRIKNDTADPVGDVTITYTGEQWRQGGNTSPQTMYFTFRTSSSPLTDPMPGNETGWTPFAALDFITPIVGSSATPLDGNDPANRQTFSNVLLPGVVLAPGDELFLRWYDINDSGNDHGFGVDDLRVSFTVVPEPSAALLLGAALLGLALRRRSP